MFDGVFTVPNSQVFRSLGTRAQRFVSNSTGRQCVLARSIRLRSSVTSCPRAFCQSPLHCGRGPTPALSSFFELRLFVSWRCSTFRNSACRLLRSSDQHALRSMASSEPWDPVSASMSAISSKARPTISYSQRFENTREVDRDAMRSFIMIPEAEPEFVLAF